MFQLCRERFQVPFLFLECHSYVIKESCSHIVSSVLAPGKKSHYLLISTTKQTWNVPVIPGIKQQQDGVLIRMVEWNLGSSASQETSPEPLDKLVPTFISVFSL